MPSKELAKADATEFLLAQEALEGAGTNGVNLERAQHHDEDGWMVFEFLKLGSPPDYYWRDNMEIYESEPNNYWDKNARKFVSLWKITQQLRGTLYLVNYSVREATTVDEVPDDCAAQPYTRIRDGKEEKVYYYIDKEKGAYVMEVTDVKCDLSLTKHDNPVSVRGVPELGQNTTHEWDEFVEWFQRMNAESSGEPDQIEIL